MINDNEIMEIVAKQAKVDLSSVMRETKLADLNLESIDIVELVFAIEEKFDIEVPYAPSDQNSAGISFKTVGDVIEAVNGLVAKQHPEKVG